MIYHMLLLAYNIINMFNIVKSCIKYNYDII
jgi:hypothetical protein